MGKGCTQPQEMLMYMLAAFDVRMNLAELLSANSASLAYLKLLESMPMGTGDMGPPVAEIKAIWEQNLMTDACTTREAVTASIKATLDNLGGKRWNGELVQDPAYKLKSAYALETDAESASAPKPTSEAGRAPGGSSGATKQECLQWASKTGCHHDQCKFLHPNGRWAKEPVCYAWLKPAGCTQASCTFTHPNGKHKKDKPSGDDAQFNKRDVTPVGKRHTPVDKGELVKVDPKAKEAHERNRSRRIRLANGNYESD
jgi:hypothetical protein